MAIDRMKLIYLILRRSQKINEVFSTERFYI